MVVEPDLSQRIARLTPLGDVLVRLDALTRPVIPHASELSAALGRTLAQDVVVESAIPAAARALRDGWAVASDLTIDAGGYAPVPLPSALRVDTGEPLPAGADAVAPLDAVEIRNGVPHALASVAPGEGVLPAGGDAADGTPLMRMGRRLDRLHVALLAAAGITAVHVRLPRLRLVRENLERTGLAAHLVVARAERPPLREADVVLLDVPCTGTGTLRRHPDARQEALFWALLRDSLDNGAVTEPFLREEMARGHLRPDALERVAAASTVETVLDGLGRREAA